MACRSAGPGGTGSPCSHLTLSGCEFALPSALLLGNPEKPYHGFCSLLKVGGRFLFGSKESVLETLQATSLCQKEPVPWWLKAATASREPAAVSQENFV